MLDFLKICVFLEKLLAVQIFDDCSALVIQSLIELRLFDD